MEGDLIKQRLKKLDELKKLGVNPYSYNFDKKDNSIDLLEEFKGLKKDEKGNKKVSVAGRVVALREMGKASFGHLLDEKGKIQFYVREDEVGKKAYNILKLTDLGDIIGIKGHIFKTKTGEVTVRSESYELLTKGVRPLPEKWHGLKDVEIRYRKRYLDLISNPDIKNIFHMRAKILEGLREFMKENNFTEVETPILQTVYGGALAKPFKTHIDAYDTDVYLSIAPELPLKKCIVGGFERVYEITKKFRNEGADRSHNPEHMTIEWYQAYADYNSGMALFEEMAKYLAKKIFGRLTFEYQGNKIDLSKWRCLTLSNAIKIYLNEDVSKIKTDSDAKNIAKKHGINPNEITKANIQDELMKLFREKLIQPTFLIDYPIESSPLAKPKRGDPSKAEVFQPFIGGLELARAYSELNDPGLQAEHFKQQEIERKHGNKEAMQTDNDFVNALEYGMPPACGVGIGIERLIMLFTNQTSIRDVILFPFMKPEQKD